MRIDARESRRPQLNASPLQSHCLYCFVSSTTLRTGNSAATCPENLHSDAHCPPLLPGQLQAVAR
eukprot:4940834-Pleurochrysis_carterae.AAC.3